MNGKVNEIAGASKDFMQCTRVAATMVKHLGMFDVVCQCVIGGRSSGGPFMGHVMIGIGAPPVSQKLKQAVDTAMKPIADKVYRRGMHMLKINTYL